VIAAVLRRPRLWPTAVRQWSRLVPGSWWRRPPFLPVPDRAYMAFRMQTQYGDPRHRPERDDLISYLTWCREWQDVTS
jgi:hypothetical protein